MGALLALSMLAGCGSQAQDEQRIANVLDAGLTSQDPTAVCEGSLSPRLLTRIYGSTQRCHAIESKETEQLSRARSVRVARVRVDGERASAVVELQGGSRDGARGQISLARERAGWRVSDLSVGLLRAQFERSLGISRSLNADLRTCVVKKMRAISDPEFKALAYASAANSRRRLIAIAHACQALSRAVGAAAV